MRIKKIIIGFALLFPLISMGATVISQGGTGITSYTLGDILYASAEKVLSKLGIGSNGKFLTITGGVPAWGDAVDLTTDQTIAGIKTFSSNVKTSGGDCSDDDEYCQKAYIDTKAIQPSRDPVRAITTTALPASSYNNGTDGVGAFIVADSVGALIAQDGITLVLGDRLLVKNQVATSTNGIYLVTSSGDVDHVWELTRAEDYDQVTGDEVANGSYTYSTEGTNALTFWALITDEDITIGTSELAYSALSPQATYYSGDGLDLNSLTFSVDLKANDGLEITDGELTVDYDDSSIGIVSNLLAVKALGITNAMLAGLIDLTTKVTGVLPETNGGTGESTFSNGQLLIGNSSGGLTKNQISEGSNVTITQGDGSIVISSTASGATYTGDGVSSTTALLTIGNDALLLGERTIAVNSTNLDYTDTGANGSYTINTKQNIHTGASPTFVNLNLTGNATTTSNSTTTKDSYVGNDLTVGGNVRVTGFASTTAGLFTTGNVVGNWLGGIIPVNRGGTGSSTIMTGNLLYGSASGVISGLLPPSVANWVLRSTGANTFAWGALVDADIPDTITASSYFPLSSWYSTTTWPSRNFNTTNSTSTNATTTNLAITGITSSFLATNPNGLVIATTTPLLATTTWADTWASTTLATILNNSVTAYGWGNWATGLWASSTLAKWGLNGTSVYYNGGNVGIGPDTTPDYLLDVQGTLGVDGLLTLTGSAANIALGSNYLSGDGGDEGISVDSSGNVGIGTAIPATYGGNLVIAGASPQLTVADNGVQAFVTLEQRSNVAYLTRDDGDILVIGTKTDSSQTSITPQITIDTSGNVGIGTTTPSAKLDISFAGDGADNDIGLRVDVVGANADTILNLTSADASIASGSYFIKATDGATDVFTVKGDGAGYFAGNVGIGDTTPDYKLDVAGTLGVDGATAMTGLVGITLGDASQAISITDTTLSKYLQVGHGDNYAVFNVDAATVAYWFQTNGTTVMELTAAGALQIDSNLTIGSNVDTVDYTLTFDGNANNGVLTWMEDEDWFNFNDNVVMAGTLGVTGKTTLVNASTTNISASGNLVVGGYGQFTGLVESTGFTAPGATDLEIRPNGQGDVTFFADTPGAEVGINGTLAVGITTGDNIAFGSTISGAGTNNYAIYGSASGATNNYAGYFVGDVYGTANASFLTYTDRTSFPDENYDALSEIMKISSDDEGQLDHSTLSDYTRKTATIAEIDAEGNTQLKIEEVRDIGASLSEAIVAIQQLKTEIDKLWTGLTSLTIWQNTQDQRIKALEDQNKLLLDRIKALEAK